MKAISLLQPWASLVAGNRKHIETRSWATRHRGELAIHASAKLTVDQIRLAAENDYFRRALELEAGRDRAYYRSRLPTGKILAVARLVECIPIPEPEGDRLRLFGERIDVELDIHSDEVDFGDFAPGRYAWVLRDIKQLPRPIPAKGRLGIWDFEWGMGLSFYGL